MKGAYFRANAGACVIDGRGRVLALRRRGPAESAWQMPQGGIKRGEAPDEAALRELREEAGLRRGSVTLLAEHPEWLVYELPTEYRNRKVGWGQAQKWFLFRARADARVVPDGVEFDAFAWLPVAELMKRVVPFRRAVYRRVLRFARARAR